MPPRTGSLGATARFLVLGWEFWLMSGRKRVETQPLCLVPWSIAFAPDTKPETLIRLGGLGRLIGDQHLRSRSNLGAAAIGLR